MHIELAVMAGLLVASPLLVRAVAALLHRLFAA